MNLFLANSSSASTIASSTADYANELANTSIKLGQNLNNELLDKMVDIILQSRYIYTSGYGANNIVAETLAFRFMLSGIKAYHLRPSIETENLHIMDHQDTIILFSVKNPSHSDFIHTVKDLPEEKKPNIILVTGSSKHPFSKYVDLIIPIPNLYLFDTLNQFTIPQTVYLLFICILTQKVQDATKK